MERFEIAKDIVRNMLLKKFTDEATDEILESGIMDEIISKISEYEKNSPVGLSKQFS